MNVMEMAAKLSLDKSGFDKGLGSAKSSAESAGSKISSAFGKIAKAATVAFSVAKMVQFSKACVSAANAQIEAETKLTTVMKQRMNATDAQIQGMKDYASELQRTGVVGDETALSGAQQVATFLNSTKALKTLLPAMENLAVQQHGVNVSTQDMVGIGNMFGKVMQGQTAALSRVGITFTEAEEAALKYGNEEQRAATLAQVITNNVGNMNQVLAQTPSGRIAQLKNNFGDLMETLGKGILVAVSPLVSWLNMVVLKAQQAVVYLGGVAKQVAALFNIKLPTLDIGGSGTSNFEVPDMSDADASASSISDSTANASDNLADANKNAKKLSRTLMGFDQINKLSEDASSDSGNTGVKAPSVSDAGLAPTSADLSMFDEMEKKVDGLHGKFGNLINRAKELGDLFKKGFEIGFGNSASKIEAIKKQLEGIKKHLTDIFTDNKVVGSFNKMINSFATMSGKIAGSATSVLLTAVDFITGSVEKSLEQNKGNIERYLSDIFNNFSQIFDQIGNLAVSVARIFEVFDSESAKQIGADILTIFTNIRLGVLDLLTSVAKDVVNLFTKPITDNTEKIKQVFQDILDFVSPIVHSIQEVVTTAVNTILGVYQEHISPFVQSITETISNIVGILSDGFHNYMKPVFDFLANQVAGVLNDDIKPIIELIGQALGKVFDALNDFWKNMLGPWIEYLSSMVMPILATLVGVVGTVLVTGFKLLASAVKIVVSVVTGVITVISDLVSWLSGKLSPCVSGLIEILKIVGKTFKNIFNGALQITTTVINTITSTINGFISTVVGFFESGYDTIKDVIGKIPDAFNNALETAKNFVSGAIDTIKGFFDFDWHLPHIELPHFNISGGFSLNPPSVPHFSIDWYARGGIVDAATLFGGHSVIGEAGKEAIIPLENHTEWIGKVAQQLSQNLNMGDMRITVQSVLDGRVIAQNTVNYINDTAKRSGVNPLSAYI